MRQESLEQHGSPEPAPAGPAGLRRAAEAVVLGAAAVAVATYVVVALLRIGHPFELQWMEGGAVSHVERVLSGRSLYPEPSLEFVAFVYPPLYWWVSAAVAWVLGNGFLPLRLVSFAASLGTMALLGAVVWRETRRWAGVAVAVGLYAGAYRVTGAWYDVARVDSLFVLLLVASVAVVVPARTWRGAVAAGVLLAAAALTKQSAVLAAAPLVAWLVWQRRPVGLVYAASFAVPWAAVSLGMHVASGGWYGFTTVELLAGHPVEARFWVDYPLRDLLAHLAPVAVLLAVAAARWWPRRADLSRWPAYAAAAAGMAGSSWVSRLHSGGYDDVLMPAFAAAALLAGLAVSMLPPVPWAWGALAGGTLVQAWLLAYPPAAQIPTSADVAAGRALVAQLRSYPGPVLVVSHPWYAVLAGKPGHAQAAAISDIERGETATSRAGEVLRADIARRVRERHYSAIVFDSDHDYRGFPPDFEEHYRPVDPPVLGPDEPGLRPVTDLPVRPAEWWVPR